MSRSASLLTCGVGVMCDGQNYVSDPNKLDDCVSQYGVSVWVDPKAVMHIVGTYETHSPHHSQRTAYSVLHRMCNR